jgi:hypothetical protein|nr:DUF4236 domain-containing protein [Neorhizobium tomejilense]
MGLGFRKSFKVGPFRTTLTHRGITNSVGAGGVRYSKTARFAQTEPRRSDLPSVDDPSTTRPAAKGNPVIGVAVLALLGYGLYKLFF